MVVYTLQDFPVTAVASALVVGDVVALYLPFLGDMMALGKISAAESCQYLGCGGLG